jgi:hypothetical protein
MRRALTRPAKPAESLSSFAPLNKHLPLHGKKQLGVASRRNLPIIFVLCHNASQDPDQVASALTLTSDAPQALAHGVPVIAVDGDDAVAVYRVASESVSRARQLRGPTLIESVTAVSSDSPLNGATRNGHKTIPVALLNMENYLTGKGLFDPALRFAFICNVCSERIVRRARKKVGG